jgi:CRISPR-associated exonuclease Cas4
VVRQSSVNGDVVLLGLLAAAVLAVANAVALTIRQRRLQLRDTSWLPAELRCAKLIYSECEFSADQPAPISARVDRAYALPTGILVLVEFKRRARSVVFLADVAELSAQKFAIERSGTARVAMHGYVAVVDSFSGQINPVRVALECEGTVLARYHRALAVLNGTVPPRKTQAVALCKDCAFIRRCRPDLSPLD